MKNQEIEVNFSVMLYAGIMYTGLVISGWLLIRLTIACFRFPAILKSVQECADDKYDETQWQTIVAGKMKCKHVF